MWKYKNLYIGKYSTATILISTPKFLRSLSSRIIFYKMDFDWCKSSIGHLLEESPSCVSQTSLMATLQKIQRRSYKRNNDAIIVIAK